MLRPWGSLKNERLGEKNQEYSPSFWLHLHLEEYD